eukprot:5335393-Alexandrium_andersonii.AAC.1
MAWGMPCLSAWIRTGPLGNLKQVSALRQTVTRPRPGISAWSSITEFPETSGITRSGWHRGLPLLEVRAGRPHDDSW